MARRPVLGGAGLNPFGGAGTDFGAFDIGGTNRESTLILTRVEVAWQAGQATDSEYLAALKAYASTLTANTSERLNADARVGQVTYRVEREVLQAKVDSGQKTLTDMLDYDRSKLTGLNTDSEEYRQRLNQYQSTQGAYYQDIEKDVVQSYNDGHMTTAALNAWYKSRKADPNLADNKDISDAINSRLHDLSGRLTQERDTQTINDYQKGKVSPSAFISYATHARARYAPGSNDYKDWSGRITDAHDKQVETALLYRYDLSQQYAQLAKFVASSQAPSGRSAGHTTTSHSTRTVLGTDGAWHTVTTAKSTFHPAAGPTPLQQQAYANRQIEVRDAKRQMAQIAAKVGGVGGFTSTATVMKYYTGQIGKVAKGSDEWYAIQGKLDQLNDRKHAETVLAQEGIRISYPKSAGSSGGGKSSTTKSGGGVGSSPHVAARSDTASVGIDSFMAAIAHVESGGRYTATNKSSGAHGKYQIMPANWPGWARKYLGNANAPQTPENQEKVAKGKFQDLYRWLGDWRAVAHWWLTGGSNKDNHLNPGNWSSSSRQYVDKVMAGLGKGPTSGSTLQSNGHASYGPATGGVKVPAATGAVSYGKPVAVAKGGQPPTKGGPSSGPLRVIVGEANGPKGLHITETRGQRFAANLDGAAFQKFYSQYEAAFKSGATEFSVVSGGKTTHYFIGDDVLERRDGMRQMDELKINLYREQAHAYAGTPSEITAANNYDNAVEAAARHELIMLDTYDAKGTSTGAPGHNASPIGSGIAALEKTVAAIEDHMKLADAAMKRGDMTTAYSHYQLAADLRASKDDLIAGYSIAGQRAVAAVEKAYGVSRSEALGVDAEKQLAKDLDRLNGFGTELDAALGKGTENLNLLKQIIKKDQTGAPVFDASGPGGQLQLADNWHYEVQGNGEVKPVMTPPSGFDPQSGKPVYKVDKAIKIDYLAGSTVVSAYAKYGVGTVGYITTPDGQRVPIEGKTFTKRRDDGTDELWVEDPFRPGHWSSTPIAYKAPSSFKSEAGPNGSTVFHFDGLADSGRGNGAMGADGSTYTLQFDPTTGTYVAYRSKAGGLFSQEVKDEPLGSLSEGSFAASAFSQSGFSRDTTGLTNDQLTFSNMQSPFVGGDAGQYRAYLSNFKSPFNVDDRSYDAIEHQRSGAGFGPSYNGAAPTNRPMTVQEKMMAGGRDEWQASRDIAAVSGLGRGDRGYDAIEAQRGNAAPGLKPLAPLPTASATRAAQSSIARLGLNPTSLGKGDSRASLQAEKAAAAAAKAKAATAAAAQARRDAAANAARAKAQAARTAAAAAAARKRAADQAAQHQAITHHAIGHGQLE